jgi:hypothetical protein
VYIKLVVLLRNYVTMMHGQQNIKNGWATIVVVGRLRVNATALPVYKVCDRAVVPNSFRVWIVLISVRSSNIFFRGATTQIGLGRFFIGFYTIRHTHTHMHPAGVLWAKDQLVTEAATYTTYNTHESALSGIQTRDHRNRTIADSDPRPHGHRDRHYQPYDSGAVAC